MVVEERNFRKEILRGVQKDDKTKKETRAKYKVSVIALTRINKEDKKRNGMPNIAYLCKMGEP